MDVNGGQLVVNGPLRANDPSMVNGQLISVNGRHNESARLAEGKSPANYV